MLTPVVGLQAGYGHIDWNLPPTLEYQPGQPIHIVLRVINPGPETREYQLYKGLFDPLTGELIPNALWLLKVDQRESFTVPAGGWVQMEGEITVDRTGVILAIILFDVALATSIYYAAVHLLGVAPPPALPPGQDLAPILGGFLAVAVLGMMTMKMKGLLAER